jgi:hypothetical protein
LLSEWNRCHGAFYQIDANDLGWNLQEQDWLSYRLERIAGVRVLLASASDSGAGAGISPNTLWLSLYGEIPSGRESELVEKLVERARSEGRTRVTIGGEEFHFVSGVPVDEQRGQQFAEALTHGGFSSAEEADFVGQLGAPSMAAYISEARAKASQTGCELREVSNSQDERRLAEFLVKEFPGRWEREFRYWRDHSGTGRAFWNLLSSGDGQTLGFSRLALRGRIHDLTSGWNPGALKLPLREQVKKSYADSCLGPIGISASERGRGTGKILLGLSLHKLQKSDAEDLCIDWTNAYNYYTPLGVRISRKFHSMWKDL